MTLPSNTVVIEKIDLHPDRFGRLYPSVFASTPQDADPNIDVEFPDIHTFLKLDYREGDQVAVQYIGNIPMLGAIVKQVEKTDSDLDDQLDLIRRQRCPGCFFPLTHRNMGLYCDSTTCSIKNIERISYACQKNVLDLPIPRHDVYHWYSSLTEDVNAPVTRFLSSEKQDIFHLVDDEDEINRILDVFKTRRIQLEGTSCSNHVQALAQNCFLDALSVRGLDAKNRTRLIDQLMQNRWHWLDLPSVLTDPHELLRSGISKADARDIVNASQINIDEITSFSYL